MKKTFFLILSLIQFAAYAQHSIAPLWDSEPVFKFAEGIIYEPNGTFLYVANTIGNPMGRDGEGTISKVTLDGKLIQFDWIKGLNAPKDIEVFGNRMYIADLDELVVVDTDKAEIIKKIKIEDTRLLHNISVDKQGVVYVGDMFGGIVYKVVNDVATKYLEGYPSLAGLLCDGDDLYFMSNGKVYKSDKNKTITTITEGLLPQVCSLVKIKVSEFIATCWVGTMYYITADGKNQLLQDTRKEQLTNGLMYYDKAKNILYMTTDAKDIIKTYTVK
ncbi:MAG: hypothetical protein R2822_13250 [Spirosomataceae bacterium]